MPDYEQGKVYMIWSPHTDKVYIGSTTQPLHKRFDDHKRNSRNPKRASTTVKEVLDCGEAKIELIEDYPCANRTGLNRREGQIQRERTCVNKLIAGRTTAEYRQDHKEERAAYRKEYHQRPEVKEHQHTPEVKARRAEQARERYHRPGVKALRQEYRQKPEVKARQNELARVRRQENKEAIAARSKEYRQRPEVKARQNALARARRQRKKEELLEAGPAN
jgi:hypothetical protein